MRIVTIPRSCVLGLGVVARVGAERGTCWVDWA